MLDIVAAIFATAYCAAQTGLLIGPAPLRGATKIAAFAAAAAWLAAVVAVYGFRVLSPGALGPVPVNLVPFTLLLAILFGAWALIPQARNVLLSVQLPALVAVHAGRIAGVFFLLRPTVGAVRAGRRHRRHDHGRYSAIARALAGAWDQGTAAVAWSFAFGMLDLLTAVTLAALSVPGTPFRVFSEGPGTLVMGTLPWIFVPAMLVPIDLLVHVVIMAKLRSGRHSIGAMAMAMAMAR